MKSNPGLHARMQFNDHTLAPPAILLPDRPGPAHGRHPTRPSRELSAPAELRRLTFTLAKSYSREDTLWLVLALSALAVLGFSLLPW